MLTVYICAAALVMVLMAGGSPRRLADVRIERAWLLVAALVGQILIISVVPHWHPVFLGAAHVASYGVAGAWLLSNRHLPGIWLIGIGGALNGLVVGVNGGVRPASETAVLAAGSPAASSAVFQHSAVLPDPRLSLLGDVFATPPWLPGNSVFSVSDLMIWAGVGVFLWRTCHESAQHTGRHRDLLIGGAVSARPAPRHREGAAL